MVILVRCRIESGLSVGMQPTERDNQAIQARILDFEFCVLNFPVCACLGVGLQKLVFFATTWMALGEQHERVDQHV